MGGTWPACAPHAVSSRPSLSDTCMHATLEADDVSSAPWLRSTAAARSRTASAELPAPAERLQPIGGALVGCRRRCGRLALGTVLALFLLNLRDQLSADGRGQGRRRLRPRALPGP